MMITHPDLFNEDPTPMTEKKLNLKARIGYRDAREDEPRCKECMHLRKKENYNNTYYKCAMMGSSNSAATDVRLKGTCRYYTPPRKEENERILLQRMRLRLVALITNITRPF